MTGTINHMHIVDGIEKLSTIHLPNTEEFTALQGDHVDTGLVALIVTARRPKMVVQRFSDGTPTGGKEAIIHVTHTLYANVHNYTKAQASGIYGVRFWCNDTGSSQLDIEQDQIVSDFERRSGKPGSRWTPLHNSTFGSPMATVPRKQKQKRTATTTTTTTTTAVALTSAAFVMEGNIVKLPSHDEAPACEADRWFYAVAQVVAVNLEDGLYIHRGSAAVDYDRAISIKRATAFADKVNAAGEINLAHWNRVPSYEERSEYDAELEAKEEWR